MSEKHTEGVRKGEFCAQRTSSSAKCKCPSKNNYIANCSITGDFFLQGTKKMVKKKFEAHHILCIASVTEFVGKDQRIEEIVKMTRWCINDSHNMIGLPVWGHTINHYCAMDTGGLLTEKKAPWFENLPQHDYDHNSTGGYKDEVDEFMLDLANQVKALADEAHESPEKDLKSDLEYLSDEFRGELKSRGSSRCGGTHKAWKKGSEEPESDWYLPFSMAEDDIAEKRRFPAKGINDTGKMAEKLKKMTEAFKRWGST